MLRPMVQASRFLALVCVFSAAACSATGSSGNRNLGGGGSGAGGSGAGGAPTGGSGGAGTGGASSGGAGGMSSGGASTGGASAGGTAGSGGTSGSGNGGSGFGGSSGCVTCSTDFKSVTDCNGKVTQTCASGETCVAGACVKDPCTDAANAKAAYGCDYWAMNLDNIMKGACYAAFVTNTTNDNVLLHVEYNGKQLPVDKFARVPNGQGSSLQYLPYDPINGLPGGEVAILFLAQTPQLPPPVGEACPKGITPAITTDPAVHGTGMGHAFHITANSPIVAYQIFPYGGGNAAITSATLLFPTTTWGTNYIGVNAYAKTQVSNNWGLPSMDILAQEDGTQVTISPVHAIVAKGAVAGTPSGTPQTYTLSRGQFVQFSQDEELTGSAIVSTKPVAVFGGSSCMNIPVGVDACDTGQQQIPPVRALGHEYVAVRYKGRQGQNESVPWRLVGAIDGTQLTYTPSAPAGAPTTLNNGQLVEFNAPGPFIVSSQDAAHPFYVASYMTGGSSFNGEGDPEFVNVIPTAQYMKSYVFFTDPTYPETSLVLVRKKGSSGFEDVKLDCSGVVGGWQPLGAYEWTRVDLVTGAFKGVGGCANGRHLIQSNAPFAATVWGWGSLASAPYMSQYVSYAYPAGAGVGEINDRTVPADPR